MLDAGDFDARRVGWWQRRAVVRRIKASPGLMSADRELRLQGRDPRTRAASCTP